MLLLLLLLLRRVELTGGVLRRVELTGGVLRRVMRDRGLHQASIRLIRGSRASIRHSLPPVLNTHPRFLQLDVVRH
jgi:hypothetical protein